MWLKNHKSADRYKVTTALPYDCEPLQRSSLAHFLLTTGGHLAQGMAPASLLGPGKPSTTSHQLGGRPVTIAYAINVQLCFIRNICDALISLIIRRDSKCRWDNLHLLNICQSTKMFSIVMSTLVTCRKSQKSTKGHHHGWHCSY